MQERIFHCDPGQNDWIRIRADQGRASVEVHLENRADPPREVVVIGSVHRGSDPIDFVDAAVVFEHRVQLSPRPTGLTGWILIDLNHDLLDVLYITLRKKRK